MNNEPVAWMDKNDPTIINLLPKWADDIPLYTHPAKTLTDEEILEVAQKMGWQGALGFLINFARAILRKAQEK
jgi:hypothetical protein